MNNPEHKKKMLAPILITVLFLVFLAVYGTAAVVQTGWSPVLLLFVIPLIALAIGMLYTLKTRIKEIRSGEEDDLDNY